MNCGKNNETVNISSNLNEWVLIIVHIAFDYFIKVLNLTYDRL